MTEPIFEERYWKERLRKAQSNYQLHHAIFKCPSVSWERIARAHRSIIEEILLQEIPDYKHASILDVGCGWGRLLDLLPSWWQGRYVGVDLSPDFVELGNDRPDLLRRGEHAFGQLICGDMRDPPEELCAIGDVHGKFDIAILISFRPMVKRNAGVEEWELIQRNVRAFAERLLFLEYDEDDEGSLE